MNTIFVNKDELFNVLQYINLIKVKFQNENSWKTFPISYATENGVEIISESKRKVQSIAIGQKIECKFQKSGYEYIINGDICELGEEFPAGITIKFSMCMKYYNKRKYIRFDINSLDAEITQDNMLWHKGYIINLSKGGALFNTDIDLSTKSQTFLKIYFHNNIIFDSPVEIARKINTLKEEYSYGFQFKGINQDNLRILYNEIRKLEMEYFKSLDGLREYIKKSESFYETKIAIISDDIDESYDIRESLTKLGAYNFEILNDLDYYKDFLIDLDPQIIIMDINILSVSTLKVLDVINADLEKCSQFLILPIDQFDKWEEVKKDYKNFEALFKPLIFNEFEDRILKCL